MTATQYEVAVETQEAYTSENAEDAVAGLVAYAPIAVGSPGTNLTIVIRLTASGLAQAAADAERAVADLAGMRALALEVSAAGHGLARAEAI
ncbi:hypothetical protein K8F61_17225 [Microbacterium resistens]|uniref:Uncharacterized protein n=1 Tax=Microbacterium resistens TaxID=156977 RepID=A0ABY3RQZ8_9MICO|nr:hypothetical protein [Microbacterium resistens]UGS26346.1 hypothetical protein K8F61_17225 [Microbacterium resistens]